MNYSKTSHRIINEVTQSSIYPIPWTAGKETRPADYFERIQNHGHLKRLVLPYIQAMITNTSCDSREVYMPIVMPGKPHHWIICILSLDQNNKPHLAYIDSSIKPSKDCVGFCQDRVLPEINRALAEHQLDTIEGHEIHYNISKQFSQKGCGISASLTIEKLMTDEMSSEEGIALNQLQEGNEPFTSLSMEQDALRRVQLAFSLTRHQHYIEERLNHNDTLSPADRDQMRKYKERLMDEIRTHPHSLKESADEAFNEKKSR